MELVNALGIICEFSTGLAGFTAIVAVFSSPEQYAGSALEFRVRNLLAMSFVPGFISLLVIGLSYGSIRDQIVVRIGSGIFAFYLVSSLLLVLVSRFQMSKAQVQELNRIIWWISIFTISLNIVFQFFNAFSPTAPGASVLILGLAACLFLGALAFTAIVAQIMSSRKKAT